jgi:hypothetical protein
MNIKEAIDEARDNAGKNFSTEPCVVRALVDEIDSLRKREQSTLALLSEVFECVEYAERCGGLDSVSEVKVRRALRERKHCA